MCRLVDTVRYVAGPRRRTAAERRQDARRLGRPGQFGSRRRKRLDHRRPERPFRRDYLRRAGPKAMDGRQQRLPPHPKGSSGQCRGNGRREHLGANGHRLSRSGSDHLSQRPAICPVHAGVRPRGVRSRQHRHDGQTAPRHERRKPLCRRHRRCAGLRGGTRRRRDRRVETQRIVRPETLGLVELRGRQGDRSDGRVRQYAIGRRGQRQRRAADPRRQRRRHGSRAGRANHRLAGPASQRLGP